MNHRRVPRFIPRRHNQWQARGCNRPEILGVISISAANLRPLQVAIRQLFNMQHLESHTAMVFI
jgi:hypothetical protein